MRALIAPAIVAVAVVVVAVGVYCHTHTGMQCDEATSTVIMTPAAARTYDALDAIEFCGWLGRPFNMYVKPE